MTRAEQLVCQKLMADGYEVINRGWPDLLASKDGQVRAIEVKTGKDFVKPDQAKCHELLRSIGVPVEVAFVEPSPSTKRGTWHSKPRLSKIHFSPALTPKQLALAVDKILIHVIPEIAFGHVTVG